MRATSPTTTWSLPTIASVRAARASSSWVSSIPRPASPSRRSASTCPASTTGCPRARSSPSASARWSRTIASRRWPPPPEAPTTCRRQPPGRSDARPGRRRRMASRVGAGAVVRRSTGFAARSRRLAAAVAGREDPATAAAGRRAVPRPAAGAPRGHRRPGCGAGADRLVGAGGAQRAAASWPKASTIATICWASRSAMSKGWCSARLDYFADLPAGAVMVVKGEREHWVPAAPQHLLKVDLAAAAAGSGWTGRQSSSDAAVKIEVVTLFPEMIRQALELGITGRAHAARLARGGNRRPARAHERRAPHGGRSALWRRTGHGAEARAAGGGDCRGGGAGAGGQPADLSVRRRASGSTRRRAAGAAKEPGLVLVAGRYEGIDERVIATSIDEELSVGDYVLSGGELPALVVIDALARLMEGALNDARSSVEESFCGRSSGLAALHPTRGVRGTEGAGGAAERRPRAHTALAADAGAGKDVAATAGPVPARARRAAPKRSNC